MLSMATTPQVCVQRTSTQLLLFDAYLSLSKFRVLFNHWMGK
jgi:hypothetical protein